MEKLVIENDGFSNDTYTFNELFEEINEEEKFDNFLRKTCKEQKYEKLELYLDRYIEYICDLIDEADSFIIDTTKEEKKLYLEKLNYLEKYKMMYSENGEKPFKIEVFDISEKNKKKILKDNICFNIGDCDMQICIIPVNRKYIINKEKLEGAGIIKLLNKNLQIARIEQQNGYIHDYRPKEEIERHKEKYRKMK